MVDEKENAEISDVAEVAETCDDVEVIPADEVDIADAAEIDGEADTQDTADGNDTADGVGTVKKNKISFDDFKAGKRGKTGKEDAQKIAALQEQLLRQAAEYDNFRKRTARERMELEPDITARVVTEFLPVFDNFERALAAETADDEYKKGIEMIYGSFKKILEKLNVETLPEEGIFDPAFHQAVQQVDSDLESGTITATLQKGYKLGGKILRFAMVAVSR